MLIIYDVIIEIEAACLLESEVLLRTPLSNDYSYTRDGTIPFLYEFTLIMIFMRQSNTYLDISCQEKKPTWFQFKWIQHKTFDFYFLNKMMKKTISQIEVPAGENELSNVFGLASRLFTLSTIFVHFYFKYYGLTFCSQIK